ncbi:MAG TPA: hypothetical protein VFI25_16375 [Planctomycetota bacterium]|nr:hypothetical protein [Planctomycetota bacterium]
MAAKIELRTFVFLDAMQPQFTAFVATTARGYLPITGDAALFVEVAPGIAINRITDVALKKTDVRPAIQVVERTFGLLEVHSSSQSEVREAGRQILSFLGCGEGERLAPRILTSETITNVSDYQLMLINRARFGQMMLAGETLYVLEVHPAGYATIAANEAEKTSPIRLLDLQSFGAVGRLYLSGTEAQIHEASRAVHATLEAIEGRPNEGKG